MDPTQIKLLIPSGQHYAAAARVLCKELALGPDQMADAADPVDDDTPVIALGNMMDSPFLHRMYLALDDITDRAWPGPGGWALRSSLTPMSRSGPVLIVSVSEPQDAVAAARALLDRIPGGAGPCGEPAATPGAFDPVAGSSDSIQAGGPQSRTIPYLHEVQLGRWAALYEEAVAPFLAEPETPWEETGGAGDWDYMMVIARMGMAAVKNGDQELVSTFVGEILRFAQVRFFERTRQDPIMIHGFLRHMLIPFALLEHHPAISASQRHSVVEGMLAMMRSEEGAANPRLLSDGEHHRVRQNHATRTALDVFTCGRYFSQVHGLEEAQQWMGLAHKLFAPQLTSSKPVEDSWGHQWRATLYNTADYALQAGLDDYVQGPVFREAADRALLAHTNLETGPLLYLLMTAAATGDDAYLTPVARDGQDALVQHAVADLGGDETGRSWVTGRSAVEPTRLTGLHKAPLSRLFYDSVQHYGEYAPAGIYTQDTPWEQSFDKIAWRSGWTAQDDYLLIDGVSGGSHAYQDANAIVRFTAQGQGWFGGPDYGKWSTASVREHCAVSVVVDGCGPGGADRYARLLRMGQIDGAQLVSTQMTYPGMAHWRRHVICAAAGWYVCIDEVEALVAGDFLVEGRWNVLGDVELAGDALRSGQPSSLPDTEVPASAVAAGCGGGSSELTMRAAGHQHMLLQDVVDGEGLTCRRWVLRTAGELGVGDHLRLVTAWRVDERDPVAGSRPAAASAEDATAQGQAACAADAALALEQTAAGCRVEGIPISLGSVEDFIERDGVWWLPGASTVHTGSAQRFQVVAEPPWMPVWELGTGAPITSMSTIPTARVVATASGMMSSRDLASAAIGLADGGVRLIDATGQERQRWMTGGAVRDMAVLPDGATVVGGDDATIRVFEANGELRWSYEIQWQPMSWEYWTRLHCGIVSLVVMDLDGDGEMEVIAGCADRHLYAFDTLGRLLWRTACQWGVPTSLTGATGAGGEALVLAGMSQPSIHGWCRVHDGDGQFLHALERPDIVCWSIPSWTCVLHVADVDDDGQDEVITGLDTNHRQLIVYRLDGEILWEADLGAAVTAVAVRGDLVIAGAANGVVSAYAAGDGTRRWTAFLVHPVRALQAHEDQMIVGLAQGGVVALDQAGRVMRVATPQVEAAAQKTAHVGETQAELVDGQVAGTEVQMAPWGGGILTAAGSRLAHLA